MIETFRTVDAAAEAAAFAIGRQLAEGLRTHGRASLVATGGRSPGPVFDRLLQVANVDWARVVVTLSDERCVAESDPASNAGLVRERLIKRTPAKAHLLPLWPEPPDVALQAIMPFDAVMLGMGEDGHIASLIPGDLGLAAAMDPASQRLIRRALTRLVQHLHAEHALQVVDVVAQSRARHRLPVTFHTERLDLPAHPIKR